jgi:PAS domain S-box-containing protein
MKTLLFGNGIVSLDDVYPYQSIDLSAEAVFDDLTRLAAGICQTPIAMLCLIAPRRRWLTSQVGLDSSSTEAYLAFCAETLLKPQSWDSRVVIIEDTLADQRFANDELVNSQAKVRFFAGTPLVTPQGVVLGILAVSDRVPRVLTLQQKEALVALSTQALAPLKLRKNLTSLKEWVNKSVHRKQERQELHQELANLNLALEQTSMVSITDPRGKIQFVNDQFCNISKYSRKELLGKDHHLINSGYHSSDFFKQMWVTIRKGKVWEGEIRNRAKDGSFYWVNSAIMPVMNVQAKPCAYVSVCQDITERKRMEEESLSQANYEMDHFFTLSPDLMCIIGFDGDFKRVNPAFEKNLSYTPEELISKAFLDFVHPDDKAATQEAWENLSCNTETLQVEHRYRCLDGSYKWLTWDFFWQFEKKLVYGIAREAKPSQPAKATLLERANFSTLEADVGAALGQNRTLVESLKRCTDAMVQHLDAIGAGIWLVEPPAVGTGKLLPLYLQASAGELLPTDTFPAHVPPNHHLIGTIAQTKQPLNTQLSSQGGQAGSVAINFSGYPLIVDARLVGVIALHSRHRFSKVVHNVLEWVANAIATAIHRAWTRDELLSHWEALLCRLAHQIHNSLDLDTILNTAVTEIQSWLKVDCCHLLWYTNEPDRPILSVTHEARNPGLPSLMGENLPPHLEPLAEIIRNQKTLRIDDLSETPYVNGETRGSEAAALLTLLSHWGITAGLLLPLKTHTGQLGVIACSHYNGPRQWSDREVELLQAVVDQIAIAIEQAELLANNRAATLAAQTQADHLKLALKNLQQTETWLIQTEKMSGLGQMVAGVAHEINNPVSFITGNLSHATNYIQDLLDLINYYQQYYPNPAPEIKEFIEEIDLEFLIEDLPKILSSMKIGADRIHEIVLSLRNFSRLDDVQMKPLNIHEGIDNTLLILHNRLKPKGKHPGITVIKEYGDVPPVVGYTGQLNQVFMNIISNAIDALECWSAEQAQQRWSGKGQEGGERQNQTDALSSDHPVPPSPTIWINTEILDGNHVVIRIRDNGPGMQPSVVRRLFDPFFTTKPLGKGTGLGLSISHQIVVEKHGGVLQCYSEPGQGAEFWIQIPISPLVRGLKTGD